MRIVSFLPSATEMVFALGLGDQLVGVTHECDYPDEAHQKPVVVRSAIDTKKLTQKQIDEAVSQHLRMGHSLYQIDERLLQKLAPDLILTQDLCQVCAPSGNEAEKALRLLPKPPRILWLTPTSLEDIFQNILEVGKETQKVDEAEKFVEALRKRVEKIRKMNATISHRPRVFCMEWLDPIYNAGHWMNELIQMAGGFDGLSESAKPSIRIPWSSVLEFAPEILILSACGLNVKEIAHQAHLITKHPGWEKIPAVQDDQVWAVDANAYFARPGPRIVDGLEILAKMIHPKKFAWLEARPNSLEKIHFK